MAESASASGRLWVNVRPSAFTGSPSGTLPERHRAPGELPDHPAGEAAAGQCAGRPGARWPGEPAVVRPASGGGWSLWQRPSTSLQDGVEPTGTELTHREKETPSPVGCSEAPGSGLGRTEMTPLGAGWHSPREQQKPFLGERDSGWISWPGLALPVSASLASAHWSLIQPCRRNTGQTCPDLLCQENLRAVAQEEAGAAVSGVRE